MTFGEDLGKAAYRVAQKMGNTKSTGKCALAVGDAISAVLGENVACRFRGNAYQWLPKLHSDLGKIYWTFYKKSKDTKFLPAGSLVVWDKQPTHPYGHIEIADGSRHLCSDFIRPDSYALYINNPANIEPEIFVPKEVRAIIKNELPYDVKVTASKLNIRKSPDTCSNIVATADNGMTLTVWAIVTKEDRKWGKNSKGYFALEYTEKV